MTIIADSAHVLVESSPAAIQQSIKLSKPHKQTVAAQNTLHAGESGDPHELFIEHVVTMRYSIDAGELAERRSKKLLSLQHRKSPGRILDVVNSRHSC